LLKHKIGLGRVDIWTFYHILTLQRWLGNTKHLVIKNPIRTKKDFLDSSFDLYYLKELKFIFKNAKE
jgi:hypothetical protein